MSKKAVIIISIIVGIVFLLLGMLSSLVYYNKDTIFKSNIDVASSKEAVNSDVPTEEKKETIVNEDKTTSKEVKEETSKKETTSEVKENTPKETISKEVNKTDTTNEVEYSTEDKTVINEMENTLNTINNLDNDKDISSKAKATFVNIVDFLFYDGEINGVTFDMLTTNGKEKVLELSQKIDAKLEEKVPGYKESISSGTKKAYTKASEIIKKGANNLNDFAKEKLGEENYNSIIEAKDELVKYTKNAFSLIKNSSSKLFTSTKDKLNDWYQNFKNK